KGEIPAAVLNLRRAVERNPENAAARSTLALVLEGSGETIGAERQYRTVLEQDPRNVVAMNNLAYLLSQRGSLDDALALAQRARGLGGEMLESSDAGGGVYLKMNKPEQAIEVFEPLVQKQPERSTFRYHLAMALLAKGERYPAAEQLRRALTCNPPEEEARK